MLNFTVTQYLFSSSKKCSMENLLTFFFFQKYLRLFRISLFKTNFSYKTNKKTYHLQYFLFRKEITTPPFVSPFFRILMIQKFYCVKKNITMTTIQLLCCFFSKNIMQLLIILLFDISRNSVTTIAKYNFYCSSFFILH